MHNAMDFLIKHGYIVIFVAVFIEQIGLPVPSGPVLLAAGALVGFHRLSLAPVLALAVAASLISDSLWFSLGIRRGGSVLKFVCIAKSPSNRIPVFPRHIPLICAMAPNRS
jgi:membrane protein DedA with SNARE-associated domain